MWNLSFLFFTLVLSLQGCVPYKKGPDCLFEKSGFITEKACYFNDYTQICQNKRDALDHPLYKIIPRHRSQIYWYDAGHWITWSLFGNDEHGIFGEDHSQAYQIEKPISYKKALCWWIRNPLHNFFHYVIGTAQFSNSQFTLVEMHTTGCSLLTYRLRAAPMFQGDGSSFYCGFHGWKPFIALRLVYGADYKGETYLGWRTQGNFGVKFVPFTTRKLEQAALDCD